MHTSIVPSIAKFKSLRALIRYLPDKGRELNGALSDRNRSDISQEVVQFISAVTGQIQEINNIRDDLMSEAEEDYTALFDHYKLIKESLLSVS